MLCSVEKKNNNDVKEKWNPVLAWNFFGNILREGFFSLKINFQSFSYIVDVSTSSIGAAGFLITLYSIFSSVLTEFGTRVMKKRGNSVENEHIKHKTVRFEKSILSLTKSRSIPNIAVNADPNPLDITSEKLETDMSEA